MDNRQKFASLAGEASCFKILKKITLSKPRNDAGNAGTKLIRSAGKLKTIGGKLFLQFEEQYTNGKVIHRNIEAVTSADVTAALLGMLTEREYAQGNLMTTEGDCELRVSKSGTYTLLGKLKKISGTESSEAEISSHNKQKNYILSGSEAFLAGLGVSDGNGRIHDKKQAKFRQINRFLEHIRDIYDHLPAEGPLYVCDLCCGKSYLSFAAYYYLAEIQKRETYMVGVDLKADVIEYCDSLAQSLGFQNLHFYSGDISKFENPLFSCSPNLVISLHACDIATDLVLDNAVKWGADVILSTPCCHHELNRILNCPELSFIAAHSMLRQKFCDAATDALRLAKLEMCGYETAALELIDPEDTPKNILLRAVKRQSFDPASKEAEEKRQAYESARRYLIGE